MKGENTGDMVGPGIRTQDLSDESLVPYRSELSRQPEMKSKRTNKKIKSQEKRKAEERIVEKNGEKKRKEKDQEQSRKKEENQLKKNEENNADIIKSRKTSQKTRKTVRY